MNRLHRLAPLLLVLAFLPGCSLLGQLAASAFDPPKLEYVSWSAEALDADGVTIALHYRLTNPNAQGFRLSRVGWALDLEGKPAVKGDMSSGITVPAKGTAPLDVPVRLRWRDVPDLVQTVATKRDVAFLVKGSVAVATPLGDVDVPFSRDGRIEIPRAPGFQLDGVRVRELSATNVSIDVRLKVANGNRFPLPVGALTYGLRLDGNEVASGAGQPVVAVPPGGTATVTIPVRLSLLGAGAAIQRLVTGGDVPVQVKGTAGFGDLAFPFQVGDSAAR